MGWVLDHPVHIALHCGDLLKIDSGGRQTRGAFDADQFDWNWNLDSRHLSWYASHYDAPQVKISDFEAEYVRELKSVAETFGLSPGRVDALLQEGFSTDEIEEALYCCNAL